MVEIVLIDGVILEDFLTFEAGVAADTQELESDQFFFDQMAQWEFLNET